MSPSEKGGGDSILIGFHCPLDTALIHLRRESQLKDWPLDLFVGELS